MCLLSALVKKEAGVRLYPFIYCKGVTHEQRSVSISGVIFAAMR